MSRFFLLLGLFFAIQSHSFCQDNERIEGFKVGLTPSAIFNRWTGYQGKASYTYHSFEFEVNLGYLSGAENEEPFSGYRIRPALKYYFSEYNDAFHYIGIGGLHRRVNIDATGTFGRFNNSFFQEFDFKLTHTLNGAYFTTGMLSPIYKDQFYIDFGIGLGRGVLTVEHTNIPEDATLIYSPPLFVYNARSEGKESYHLIYFVHVSFTYNF